MALHYVLEAEDRAGFLRCRRAWDYAARERGDREPAHPTDVVNLAGALTDALAVYYFPGMWDWSPAVVLPLVRRAFTDCLGEQRTRFLVAHGLRALPEGAERRVWDCMEHGGAMLEAYFAWAPTVDEFAPVQVHSEVDVRVPDTWRPGSDLTAPDGRPVHFRDRIDLVTIDAHNGYWMLEHRLVDGPWPDPDVLRRDERCLAWCWAWEQAHPGMRIQGTIHNELRTGIPPAATPPPGPRGTVRQSGGHERASGPDGTAAAPADYELRIRPGEHFRRVQVPRAEAELAAFGARLTAQAREMVDPATVAYPAPSALHCTACPFRAPCLAADSHGDAPAMLATRFRKRDHRPQPGRLGTVTWGLGRGAAPPS